MSGKTRSVPRNRMSQARLDSLIIRKPEEHAAETRPILSGGIEYDTLHPEETIRAFCAAVKNMLSRYQYDKEQASHLEQEMQDLLHYIELSPDKNANNGFKLYKRLAEVRRERRVCKNEMELLQPIYDTFNGSQKLDMLAQIQGACRTAKQSIDGRVYNVRTDVLDGFIKE